MNIAPITAIQVRANRQRRTFDEKKLTALAESITSKGLLHPPVVEQDADGLWLVAGERRLRAISTLALIGVGISHNNEDVPAGYIPYTLLADLDPFLIKEAELEENTVRDDLTWADKARAIAELDALRRGQAERISLPHTIRDTASEIAGHEAKGGEITKVSEALIVTKHLDDPEVAAAKTQKDALKVIRKKAEAAHREVLAANFDMNKTPHTLANASAFDFAQTLPDSTFDVILTDPPYGIGADDFGSMAGTEHGYVDDEAYAMKCYTLVAEQGFRVTKDQAHCYAFLDPRFFEKISLIFTLAGWEVWPTPLIWNKTNGMLPKPEHGPRRTYEMILFASKGKKKITRVGPDVLTHSLVLERDHGAQKPVALYKDLLSRSTVPGDKALDLFAGSGTIFPAANALKLVATASEIGEAYYNLALSRIDQADDAPSITSLLGV